MVKELINQTQQYKVTKISIEQKKIVITLDKQ